MSVSTRNPQVHGLLERMARQKRERKITLHDGDVISSTGEYFIPLGQRSSVGRSFLILGLIDDNKMQFIEICEFVMMPCAVGGHPWTGPQAFGLSRVSLARSRKTTISV
jgi:hypothetical protein